MATKISGTNTAAAPGVTGDDTDTGLFYGTNEIGFSTGGTSRLTLDSSGHLNVPDNGKIRLGTGSDLSLYHEPNNSYLDSSNGTFNIRALGGSSNDGIVLTANNDVVIKVDGGDVSAKFIDDGAVELYHSSSKTFYTNATGASLKGATTGGETELKIFGNEGQRAILMLAADDGDDNADYWQFQGRTDGNLNIQNYSSGSWENSLILEGGGSAKLYHDNNQRLYTSTTGAVVQSEGDTTLGVYGGSGGSGYAQLYLNGHSTASNYVQSDNGLIMWINGANRATFDTSGNFEVKDGNVKIATSGHGIDFSADGNNSGSTSELFDDYEQGLVTATMGNGVTLYSDYDDFTYVKVGNLVTVSGELRVNDANGGSVLKLTNLPWATKSQGTVYPIGAAKVYSSALPTGTVSTYCQGSPGNNNLYFGVNKVDGSVADMYATANGYFSFTYTYLSN